MHTDEHGRKWLPAKTSALGLLFFGVFTVVVLRPYVPWTPAILVGLAVVLGVYAGNYGFRALRAGRNRN